MVYQIVIGDKRTRIIRNLYFHQSTLANVDIERTDYTETQLCVQRSCILSTKLFSFCLYANIIEVSADMEAGIKINGELTDTLRYTDDTMPLADSVKFYIES